MSLDPLVVYDPWGSGSWRVGFVLHDRPPPPAKLPAPLTGTLCGCGGVGGRPFPWADSIGYGQAAQAAQAARRGSTAGRCAWLALNAISAQVEGVLVPTKV